MLGPRNGKRLGVYFFRGGKFTRYSPPRAYLSTCAFLMRVFLSSVVCSPSCSVTRRYGASLCAREKYWAEEYETATGRHCPGDRRTDNRNDSPAHLYLNDSGDVRSMNRGAIVERWIRVDPLGPGDLRALNRPHEWPDCFSPLFCSVFRRKWALWLMNQRPDFGF